MKSLFLIKLKTLHFSLWTWSWARDLDLVFSESTFWDFERDPSSDAFSLSLFSDWAFWVCVDCVIESDWASFDWMSKRQGGIDHQIWFRLWLIKVWDVDSGFEIQSGFFPETSYLLPPRIYYILSFLFFFFFFSFFYCSPPPNYYLGFWV